jgi:hypothetical protein
MICHRSGKDDHPALQLKPEDPRPRKAAKKTKSYLYGELRKGLTRRERRAQLFGNRSLSE